MQFKEVPVSAIETNEGLRDLYEDDEQFKGLCASVAKHGVKEPISVTVNPDDPEKYTVADGGHRLEAAKRAGLTHLVVIVEDMDAAEVERHQLEMNFHRVDTKPIDYTKHLLRMLQRNPLMTKSELAEYVSATPSFIDKRLRLLKLTDELQALVNNGDIPLSNAQALSELPQEEQPQWLDRALTEKPGEFVPACKERKKEINKARREGREAEPAGFVPKARVRKKPELEARYEEAKGKERDTLAWVLQLDAESVKAQEDEYNAKEAKKAEDKKRREKERAEKKLKEAEAAKKEAEELLA